MKKNHKFYYTTNQAQAIWYNRPKHLIISASAGAGKSETLANRLQTLICGLDQNQVDYVKENNPQLYNQLKPEQIQTIQLDEILAITFTEAAANNLKKRLSQNLSKNSQDQNNLKQLEKISSANISTVHSFCLSVIKKFHLSINLSLKTVNNLILDEDIIKLKKEAFELMIQSLNKPNYDDLLKEFKISLNPNILTTILNIENFKMLAHHFKTKDYHIDNLKSLFDDALKTINNVSEPLALIQNELTKQEITELKEIESSFLQAYFEPIKRYIKTIKQLALTLRELVLADQNDQSVPQHLYDIDKINLGAFSYLDKLKLDIYDDQSYQEFIDFFSDDNFNQNCVLLEKSRKRKDINLTTKTQINLLIDEIYENFEKITKRLISLETFKESYNQNIRISKLFLGFCLIYELYYKKLKLKYEMIDFKDYEHYAYQILKNDSYARNYYKNKFKVIMIDEFQDTSKLQSGIVNLIQNNNLFLVGDIKQSIYMFNSAKPEIFKNYLEDDSFSKITIPNNFRSMASVVYFNNCLYQKLFCAKSKYQLPLNDVIQTYKNESQTSFLDELNNQTTLKSRMVYYPSNDSEKAKKDDQESLFTILLDGYLKNINHQSISDFEYKALFVGLEVQKRIAETINKLKELKLPIQNIYQKIVVLVRNNDSISEVKKVLDYLKIPCFASENISFFQTFVNEIVTAFLRYILDDKDSEALVAILNSRLYKLEENDIFLLKLYLKESGKNYITINFDFDQTVIENNHILTTNKHKLQKIADILQELRSDLKQLRMMAQTNQILEILSYVVNIHDFYNRVLTFKEKTNFDYLVDKLSTINPKNVGELIKYIEETEEYTSEEASEISSNDDVVRIMTIHKSKGLQFEHVILLDASPKPNNASVIFDEEYGLGINTFVDQDQYFRVYSPQKILSRDKLNIETNLEFLRLFYVASTRAISSFSLVAQKPSDFDSLVHKYHLLDHDYILDNFLHNDVSFSNYLSFIQFTNRDELFKQVFETIEIDSTYLIKPNEKSNKDVNNQNIEPSQFNFIESDYQNTIQTFSPSNTKKSLTLNFNQKGMHYGTMIHQSLEKLDLTYTYSLKELEKTFNDQSIAHKIYQFLNNQTLKQLLIGISSSNIYHEYSYYELSSDNTLIHGIIDLLIKKDGEYIIVDYKTDINLDETQLKDKYQNQLLSYQNHFKNQKVKTYIYSFNLDRFIEIA